MNCAIVTGVLGGIGKATAKMLIDSGYHVIGMDVPLSPELSEYKNNTFTYVQGDLSNDSDRRRLVSKASDLGRICVLVNVAGVAPKSRQDLLQMTEESYDFVMNINTKGTLFLTQAVANEMIKQTPDEDGCRGRIVNISSCSAYTSSVSRGEYCISKAGVSMITMLFADKLAEFAVTVNEICPGIIATGMTAVVKEKYDRLIEGGLVPLKRWGQPEDVAKAVMALSDGTLGYTTGMSVIVDGGMHIRKV